MQRVADAIRNVTAIAQRAYDEGERSAAIDLHDLVEVLLAIADELETPDGESELLAAARALLEARDDQMVTSAEWDRLRKAVDAAG